MRRIALCGTLLGALLLTGCGGSRVPIPTGEIDPDAAELVTELTDAPTETTVPTETDVSGEAAVTIELEDESGLYAFQAAPVARDFTSPNSYSGEPRYSFRLDELVLTIKNMGLSLDVEADLTGEKTYDWIGEDAERCLRLIVRFRDSSGNVVEQLELDTEEPVKMGEPFERLHAGGITTQLFGLAPDVYTVEVEANDSSQIVPALPDAVGLDPDRWYVTSNIHTIIEHGAQLPFDTDAPWVETYMKKEIYVDDDLVLHGLFETPYDLHDAVLAEVSPPSGPLLADFQYGDCYYYDINDPENWLTDVPAEAMPTRIRISYSPYGSITVDERPEVFANFLYCHEPTDEHCYVAFGFRSIPAKYLTLEEWETIAPRFTD